MSMLQEFAFQPASKQQCKLRIALYGVSGSGKTYSALRIATGIGGRIAVIDTEGGSASKYAGKFQFDTVQLESPDIDTMIACMVSAAKAGYSTLIIDSLSHTWQELLDEVSQITATSRSGNSFQTWSKATPKQHRLIRAILHCPMHLIATMRAKTEYTLERNDRGKTEPKRVGLAPRQGKDIEYEFDLLGSIDGDHAMLVQKDRSSLFQGQLIEHPGEDLGRALVRWADNGTPNDSLGVDAMRAVESPDERPPSPLSDLRSQLSEPLEAKPEQPTEPDIDSLVSELVQLNEEAGVLTTAERIVTAINQAARKAKRDPLDIALERVKKARLAIGSTKETKS